MICLRHSQSDCSDTSDVGSERRLENAARLELRTQLALIHRERLRMERALGATRSSVFDISEVSLDTEPGFWVCKPGVQKRSGPELPLALPQTNPASQACGVTRGSLMCSPSLCACVSVYSILTSIFLHLVKKTSAFKTVIYHLFYENEMIIIS